ncbi:MAG TPA: hypothetical protein VJH20_03015 [Candidatus Nanoarchaeia archaeon]|nr:hypothetical protein [Candidatus Nanoarchaeia archaeon]
MTHDSLETISIGEALELLEKVAGNHSKRQIVDGKIVLTEEDLYRVRRYFDNKIIGLEIAKGAIPTEAEEEFKPVHRQQIRSINQTILNYADQRARAFGFYHTE